MKRKAFKIDQDKHKKVQFYVDADNAEAILQFVFEEKVDKEFKEIRTLLKDNLRNREKYCKVEVSSKAKGMYELRFTRQRNDRIYCKEITSVKARIIIMVELFRGKKSQDIPKRIKGRIETMGGYEYEIN